MEVSDVVGLEDKMRDFIYYFLQRIESKLKLYLDILEGRETGEKSSSLAGNVLSSAAALIPNYGKAISTGIKQGEGILSKRSEKEDAIAISKIAYIFRGERKRFRRICIEAAYEVFCCFEMQFLELTCNGGEVRAMQKLGDDAAQRCLSYLIKGRVEELNVRNLVVGVVSEEDSFLVSLGIGKRGRNVKDLEENAWNSAKIYYKVGIYDPETRSFYKSKRSNTVKYGHRLRFSHETAQDLLHHDPDTPSYNYQYSTDFENFVRDLPGILEFIASKDPEEFAQHDREIKHQTTLNLLAQNHESTLVKIDETSAKILAVQGDLREDLKSHHARHHEEVTGMLVVIAERQERLCEKEEALEEQVRRSEEEVRKVERKMEEEDAKVLIKLDREGIERELKKLDFTRSGDFKKIKKKLRDFRF